MTGQDLLELLWRMPEADRRRHIEVVLHDTCIAGDTFTAIEIGLPNELDLNLSKDEDTTADALMIRVS